MKETGWKAGPPILSWWARQKSKIGPTWWLLTPLITVTTGVMRIPAAARLSIATSRTSNRFVMWRWAFDSLVVPSNWR